ncbi:tetratricopeptide repeat protein 37-like, partial [Contarinia nasturtii]|uniref:tetratricopeptide repeat protein 37-like n=1 Tax=Contarinia nasturtii TaxID=265458 RepID=UPI0012D402BF
LANCFDFIAALPKSKAVLTIPGSLANESDEFVTLCGDKLFELASRFYCRAIKLSSSDLSLWYELSLNYYNRSLKYGTTETRKKYLELAAETSKHIIKEAPHKWKYWNLLGVICTTKDVQNLSLAQHCFIKALELDRKLAIVWTNLGVLYLSQGKIMLANTAFKQAQQSEPSFANAWTGQAQVAEILKPAETIDLLQHSITLSYNDESAIQYAYWVCMLLSDTKNQKRAQYYVEHLNAISSAIDSITWYCNANETNISSEALSFLGYLNYNQRNWCIATRTFQAASQQIEQSSNRDKMLCNLAYSLLKDNRPIEAVQAFENVTEATFRS